MIALLERLLPLWTDPVDGRGDPEAAFGEVYADTVVVNGTEMSLTALVARARSLQQAFDQLGMDILDTVETPDRVVVAFEMRGRHIGPYASPLGTVAPTGRDIAVRTIDVLTIAGGLVTAIWVVADDLGLLRQLDAARLNGLRGTRQRRGPPHRLSDAVLPPVLRRLTRFARARHTDTEAGRPGPDTYPAPESRVSADGGKLRPFTRSCWSTRQDPVLEMGDAGRLDGPHLLESHIRVPEVVEEAGTATEQHRNDVQLELVQQPRGQILLDDLAAAPQHDVFGAGGLLCLFERGLDSVGDEVERRPSLHLDRITRVMGEDEHGVVVGRVVTPPARPLLVSPGTTAGRAEHVPAHHRGADVLPRFLDYPSALVHLAAFLAVGLAPGGQRNHPAMEPLAALAERVLLALVRAGDETVQRDRDMTPKLAHRASSVGSAPPSGAVMGSRSRPGRLDIAMEVPH
jgi:predicted ester cyclase